MGISQSRLIAILASVAGLLTTGATFAGFVKPQYAVYMLAGAAAITAFTERVQGGASKK